MEGEPAKRGELLPDGGRPWPASAPTAARAGGPAGVAGASSRGPDAVRLRTGKTLDGSWCRLPTEAGRSRAREGALR